MILLDSISLGIFDALLEGESAYEKAGNIDTRKSVIITKKTTSAIDVLSFLILIVMASSFHFDFLL